MKPAHAIAYDYLREISATPALYDAWTDLNARLFDSKLRPLPLIVGLSRYGHAIGFCEVDAITIQPFLWGAGKERWLPTLAHEMCHQADFEAGLEYVALGRVNNLHNSATWCNRINAVMARLGDKRFATPYRRNRAGVMVPMQEAPPGLELIPYPEIARWHPVGL
jgi:hypothetical protein